MAALGAYGPVAGCLLLNALALGMVLERLLLTGWALDKHPVVFFASAGGLYSGTGWYCRRYSPRIIDRYEDNEWVNRIPPVVVVLAYYARGFGLVLLSAIY
ncbi:hypothetical protein GCM10022409_34000 [Hymenobacter glaciei]|uniref:Uncharacterized protein n=1 Tax=Hymenobacter glaciei TaxID=877209 RepID=A0ABP7UJT8_9BACT